MSKKSTIISLMMVIVFLSIPLVAYAETYDTANATVTITDAARIWFHPELDNEVKFTVKNVADYDDGYTGDASDRALIFMWEANFHWNMHISGSANPLNENFVYIGGGTDPEKPFTDIEFMNGTGWTMLPLSTSKYKLKSGAPGSYDPLDDTDFTQELWFRVKIAWAEPAGTYTYEHIILTLSSS